MRLSLLMSLAMIGSGAVLASCGSSLKVSGHTNDNSSNNSSTDSSKETVDASLNVTTSDAAGLYLATTSATYSGSIKGCITENAPTFSEANSSVAVFVGDTGCYARLDSITVTFTDGSTAVYTPDTNYKFAAGTSIILNSSGSTKSMKLAVSTNLPATITASPAPSVSMDMSFVDFGGSQTANVRAATAGLDINVDNTIPYQLSTIDLSVDGDTGGGAFVNKLNCYAAVGNNNQCDGLDQQSVKANLAVDTYKTNGVARNLTLDECSKLASAGSEPSATAAAGSSDDALPNGGVTFNATGPSPLCDAANKNLVFAVSNAATNSCKWWRIAVNCP